MTNDQNQPNPFLPIPAFGSVGKPDLERAAEKLVKQLTDDGMLTENHVLTVQMILDLARVTGLSAVKGRASAVALASRELREVLSLLPGADRSVEEEFEEMVKKLGIN